MRRLGISIYPEKSSMDEVKSYIKKASEAGFSRIFSCLLSVGDDVEQIKREFREVNDYAHEHGFEVILDVSPSVFEKLGIKSPTDTSVFAELGADGIRLDQGFNGMPESMMTYNKENLKIEINMSMNTHTIDTIMDFMPNKFNLYGCHNFYPHANTGLRMDFFNECTENFRKYGLKTAAFVSSQTENAFGPWVAREGLPTLEMHRHMPMDVQVKHFIALNTIDDIIISNCYPSDEELESVKDLPLDVVTFDVTLVNDIPDTERSIVLDELHVNRGDSAKSYLRSSGTRIKYRGHEFVAFHTPKQIKRGDIVIDTSEYGHYAGELQVVLEDVVNNGMTNVVGRIREEEIFILDYMKPWQKFRFREIK